MGAGDGFGAPLDLQLIEDIPVVALDRAQGQEEPFADLPVRAACRDEAQDVLLKIAAIIESHGAEIAYPTRTVVLEPEPEPASSAP